MSDCPECQAAQVRPNHTYDETCVTCEVRRISNEPHHRRLAYYATIANVEEREAFQLAVSLEFRRRKEFQP